MVKLHEKFGNVIWVMIGLKLDNSYSYSDFIKISDGK